MRLQKIAGYEAANRYPEESYLAQHNAKYAVEPAEQLDFHEQLAKGVDLDEVFSLEWERTVSNDCVVQQRQNGSLVLMQQHLGYQEIDRPVRRSAKQQPINRGVARPSRRRVIPGRSRR